MRILVVEDHIGDSTEAILDLADAGHRVVRCQPIGAEIEPCAGLRGGTCPLAETVDVAVDIKTAEGFELRELGAVCAVRAGVPIVCVSVR